VHSSRPDSSSARTALSARRARILLGVYLLVLVALVVPRRLERRLLGLSVRAVDQVSGPDASLVSRLVEPALNVALFIPLALLLCWAIPVMSRGRIWVLCVLTSCAVEVTQYFFLPAREASLRDVVTNSTGAAIGVLLHWLITQGRRTGRQPARQQ
jgi:VanZ family protein